ncbi:HBS1-like protein isoform X1 [Prunus avium]|uniref:HBS1-like protein isoform X1 n=1 Tax=Prunus avium TaxID=42229 RepID=A0A6P5U6I3_PRUAV|nr:HBS1-like protein isoform X1 [Prunus avium]XP_021834776.1 HBS1-like protein isoform X1 [Prunus avium]
MPRKGNFGVDYDDDYDAYDDYDYDYDDDSAIKNNGKALESKWETERPEVWRCSICTYDNEGSMSACDICGVLRNPVVKSNSDKKTVEGRCKDSGASIMAKSLFASLPRQIPKQAVLFHQQKDDFVIEEGNNFHKLGDFQGPIHEFYNAFNIHNNHHINIAPFKFDVPSPDDLVSNGLWSSRTGSKASVSDLKSSKVSSKVAKKSGAISVQSSAEWSDSSSAIGQTSKQDRFDEGNQLENRTVSYHDGSSDIITLQANGRLSDSSSASQPRSRHDSVDESTNSSVIRGKQQSVTSGLKNLDLDARSGSSNNVNVRGSHSQADYKPEKWMLPDQAVDTLTQLNLAIVGHVDSGKSTLSGRLLHLLGRISKKEMHKYEKEAKLQGKGSFAYAWALDESAEERERGITMTVAVAYFDSRKYHVVVLDSPGHKDFVPNMISGATQADAAILLIDASVGAFEAGVDGSKGQTKEHAQLIRSFGVDQIIVAVNKMDIVEYSKDRFDLIKQRLGTFLRSCGFKDSLVSWIPLSAMENQNLVAAPSDARFSSWYHGPYLLDAIDSLQPPTREFSKPLLMPICDVIKSSSQGQVSACGKLEAGALRSGFKVLVMPSGELGTVRSLERDSQACVIARAGDNVAVTLQGIDGGHVMAGGVLCHPGFPVAVAKHLELKVLVLDVTTPILIGSQLEFHIHHAKEAARVIKISSLLDPKTGKVTRKAPRCLTAKQNAIVEVVLHQPVCVEEFSNSRALGRAFLRALGSTIAVGIVTRIIEEQK